MGLHVAAVQMQCQNRSLVENLQVAGRAVTKAAAMGARLILLPEFFHIGYWYGANLGDYSEPLGGSTTQWLLRSSRRTGALIGGCIAESDEGRHYDTFVLATPSGELHTYRKRNPAFFEQLHFSRGVEEGIFQTEIGRIGIMICWDMVQPRLAQEMADRIDWLIISAAWPDMKTGNWPVPVFRQWMTLQARQRPRFLATMLKVPTLFSNLTGRFETRVPGIGVSYRSRFAGHSMLADGFGNVVSTCVHEETIVHGYIGKQSRFCHHAA